MAAFGPPALIGLNSVGNLIMLKFSKFMTLILTQSDFQHCTKHTYEMVIVHASTQKILKKKATFFFQISINFHDSDLQKGHLNRKADDMHDLLWT